MNQSPTAVATVSTEDVLSAVASAPLGDEAGRYVLSVFHTLRVQGRSKITEDEARAWASRAGLDWESLRTRDAGHVGVVLARGPRSTSDVALVEAWIARGIAGRLAAAAGSGRLKVLEDLIPIADHMRLLTPYDPYRMLGSFLERAEVVMAFDALTDAIVRDARALGAGRSSRLRAVITQRLESLVRVLPEKLRRPMEDRIRAAGGDPAIPVLLDAALGVEPAPADPFEPRLNARELTSPNPTITPAPAGPTEEVDLRSPTLTPYPDPVTAASAAGSDPRGVRETLEGSCESSGAQTALSLVSVFTGFSLLRGFLRTTGRLLLGLRRAATLRTGPEGVTIVERTWLFGRNIAERSGVIGPQGLTVLRVERRAPLFILLVGLLAATLGAGFGLYQFLDGIRGEYAAVVAFSLLVIGAGVAIDLAALWASERLGARSSLTLRTADGRWLRVSGLEHARAMRFAALARNYLVQSEG